MALNSNALLSIAYYETMAGVEIAAGDATTRLENYINAISQVIEFFCNRPLLAIDYSYDSESVNYNQQYAIFDGIHGTHFYFPTYPVNSLTTFIVSATTVIEATSYLDTEGYTLYNEKGLLVYDYGFDPGYRKNVKTVWNGGYAEGTQELSDIRFTAYSLIYSIMTSGVLDSSNRKKEMIGNYSYENFDLNSLHSLMAFSPATFQKLGKYRKEPFA